MHIPSLIEKKRDGGTLGDGEISDLIAAFTSGDMPEYQMSALAMAIYFKGMNAEETASLTKAMLESGECLDFGDRSGKTYVDKHSTGGIGDKVSLVLAPLLACDEVHVPMISGRGLGITGGTLDKLESIPGFNVNLDQQAALAQLDAIRVVMIGQTADICPADKKLYALRDVTATVASQPLIVASIMSKKLAESLDALVLDVKFGSGAFMKTKADAQSLGQAMCDVGAAMGVRTEARYNPMEEPLGQAVGNALEVQEAIDTLQGRGPADLVKLTLDLAEAVSLVDRKQLATWLTDGTAFKKFLKMVEAQGGDPEDIGKFSAIHPAPVIEDICAPASGEITAMDAGTIGRACLGLGAGRSRADEAIDFAVGASGIRKVGERITDGDSIMTIHARSAEACARARQRILTEALSIR